MDKKVVVTCALVGAFTQRGTSKGANPNAPITPDQMAEEAKRAYDAGAAVVHIHARDPKTGQTFLPGQNEENVKCFGEIIEKIKAKCPDMIINVTTGGGIGQPPEERLAPVRAFKPDMASFTSGSFSFGMFSRSENKFVLEEVKSESFPSMLLFADVFREAKTKPECEIYDLAMLNNIKTIEHSFEKPIHLQFVMGIPGQVTPARPRNLIALYDEARETFDSFTWGVAVAGFQQWKMITMAAILDADNIRTGMEDNLYIEEGVLASSNGQMVEKAVRLARGVGREIATPDEACKILNIG